MVLLDRLRALSKSNSERDVQSSTVKVSELSDDPLVFKGCRGGSPEADLVVSEFLSVQDTQREAGRGRLEVGLCWTSRTHKR